MQQYHHVELSPLLTSSHTGAAYPRPVPLHWDTRSAPRRAARVSGQVASDHHLIQPAAIPSITTLHIISDLLWENWAIAAHNPSGVTIDDVVSAIYMGLRVPITQAEWDCMSPMQRARTEEVFYARCGASRDFDRTRHGGVRRIDCLLHTTVFAGLSSLMYRGHRWEVVLTLSRDFGAQRP